MEELVFFDTNLASVCGALEGNVHSSIAISLTFVSRLSSPTPAF
jgi:hypothetical protein